MLSHIKTRHLALNGHSGYWILGRTGHSMVMDNQWSWTLGRLGTRSPGHLGTWALWRLCTWAPGHSGEWHSVTPLKKQPTKLETMSCKFSTMKVQGIELDPNDEHNQTADCSPGNDGHKELSLSLQDPEKDNINSNIPQAMHVLK